jgi:hypothetical protein
MPTKARNSLIWIYALIAFFLLFTLIPDRWMPMPVITRRSQFFILILWYFVSGREQGRYVSQYFPDGYEKKKWGKPLAIGFVCLIAYSFYAAVVSVIYDEFGIN